VLVAVGGELDLTNAPELEERLEDLTDRDSTLVLDLNRLVFVDSAALHVLFRAARRLGRERFGIVLEPTAAVARTVTIVGLPDVATVRGSVEELLAALAAPE
jgi:anti-anti-sigma factor